MGFLHDPIRSAKSSTNNIGFDAAYDEKSDGSKTNGLLYGSDVILSKGFTQENNLKLILNMR